ncbi:phosphotransferase [Pseudarthrobacter sp. NPDC089323]
MARWDAGRLSQQQAELVSSLFGAPELIADLSWGQMDTKVLHVRDGGTHVIVKAAGPENHHIGREITAHSSWTRPLVSQGRAARLMYSRRELNLLVFDYLDGTLVEDTRLELDEDTHAQAGKILKTLHSQELRVDDEYEAAATAKALSWLDREHRIDQEVEGEVRRRLAEYRPRPREVVPTHGDWQPRNWLSDGTAVRAIDFGRFGFRPAATDFCRLAVQQWQQRPGLEAAFLAGYGDDPRNKDVWRIDLLREAVGTAVWAYLIGDERFESQGHRMLHQALQEEPAPVRGGAGSSV